MYALDILASRCVTFFTTLTDTSFFTQKLGHLMPWGCDLSSVLLDADFASIFWQFLLPRNSLKPKQNQDQRFNYVCDQKTILLQGNRS
jgi:hypothetical protein